MKLWLAVVVYAMDVERMTAFYAAVLGVPVERPDPTLALLDGGTWELVINAIPAAYAGGIEIADPPEVRQDTPIKAILPVDDLGRARAAAAGLGGVVRDESQEWTFRGVVFCDGVDPEGNVFQLAAYPADPPAAP